MKRLLVLALGVWFCLGGVAPAQAAYPEKPVTVLCPFGAGGGTDQVARFISGLLEKQLKKPFLVVNNPGGSGARGLGELVAAKPDGYTVLLMTSNISTLQTTGHTDLTYKDMTPVASANFDAPALMVHKDSGITTLDEFIAAAKKNPGSFNIGTGSPGGLWHIGLIDFAKKADLKVNIIPATTGGAAASVQLMGKHVNAIVIPPNEAIAPLKSGEFVLLGMMSESRLPNFPDVKTFKEQGLDVSISSHRGFIVPKGTPQAIVDLLAAELEKAINSKEYEAFMYETFSNKLYRDTKEYTDYLDQELKTYSDLIKDAGLAAKK